MVLGQNSTIILNKHPGSEYVVQNTDWKTECYPVDSCTPGGNSSITLALYDIDIAEIDLLSVVKS